MARVTLTPTPVSGKFPTTVVALTETAADDTLLNQFKLTGREILIFRNTHATDAKTVTITSVAHPVTGRTGDITAFSVAAGLSYMVGPLAPEGWRQTDGYLYFAGESDDIHFQVIQIPG